MRTPNSRRPRNKFVIALEKRRTGASCKAKRTGQDNGSNMKSIKLVLIALFASTYITVNKKKSEIKKNLKIIQFLVKFRLE